MFPENITVVMLLKCIDTKSSHFTITPSLHGWRILNRVMLCDILIDESDYELTYKELLNHPKRDCYEYMIVLKMLSKSMFDLNLLTGTVYDQCINVPIRNVRLTTHCQVIKETKEGRDKPSYQIAFPTNKGVGRYNIPLDSVTLMSADYITVHRHLEDILLELHRFKTTVATGLSGLNPKQHGVDMTVELLPNVHGLINAMHPTISQTLTTEDDIYTLRVMNLSFEMSRFGNMKYIDVFAKYEIDKVRDINHLIELSTAALILFINASNYNKCTK